MYKSKSALTFREFLSKYSEIREFGNNYGQWVVIDDNKIVRVVAPPPTPPLLPPFLELQEDEQKRPHEIRIPINNIIYKRKRENEREEKEREEEKKKEEKDEKEEKEIA
jgi:hypothetical protein